MTVEIIKTAEGLELVSKADYDKAAARLEMINALMDVAKEANEHAKAGFLAMQADYDKLAAECAALNGALERISGVYKLSPHIHKLCEVETPATDAAISEFWAQGVEKFAESVAELHSKTKAGSRLEMQLAFTGGAAVSFAAQLRAGKDGE